MRLIGELWVRLSTAWWVMRGRPVLYNVKLIDGVIFLTQKERPCVIRVFQLPYGIRQDKEMPTVDWWRLDAASRSAYLNEVTDRARESQQPVAFDWPGPNN